jgi:hypothetical protein
MLLARIFLVVGQKYVGLKYLWVGNVKERLIPAHTLPLERGMVALIRVGEVRRVEDSSCTRPPWFSVMPGAQTAPAGTAHEHHPAAVGRAATGAIVEEVVARARAAAVERAGAVGAGGGPFRRGRAAIHRRGGGGRAGRSGCDGRGHGCQELGWHGHLRVGAGPRMFQEGD